MLRPLLAATLLAATAFGLSGAARATSPLATSSEGSAVHEARRAAATLGFVRPWARVPTRKQPSFFLSPAGSDSNRCSRRAPCRSFNRAYQVARPGQTVEAAAGFYGNQTVLYDSSKEGARRNVVIQPARRAPVTIGDLVVGPSRSIRGATHLTVRGVVVAGDVAVNGCGAPSDGQQCIKASGGNYLQFVNLDVRGTTTFFCASCDHVTILGGRWGPKAYNNPCVGSHHPEVSTAYDAVLPGLRKDKRPNHLTIDGAIFENFARCSSSDHTECLQTEPSDYLTIRNSVFRRCDTIVINITENSGNSLSPAGHIESDHILIENSFFDQATDATAANGEAYYSLRVPSGTNVTLRNNSWLDQPLLSSSAQYYKANYRLVGNVGPFSSSFCENGYTTYSHNVFSDTTCGDPSSKAVGNNFGFADPSVGGSLDLHLLAGSPAINAGDPNDFPAMDIDGQARPLGGLPDAGADERQ
jgi:hypothetical protein